MRLPSFMGFEEEQHVPQQSPNSHLGKDEYWTEFYTCIANKKRVYVWAWRALGNPCCVMVDDLPYYGASGDNSRACFKQLYHTKTPIENSPCDELILQSIIHKLTLEGNENV